MRSSQIVQRPHDAPTPGSPWPGYGWLLAAGYLVELGPGLVAGATLFERVRGRLTEGLGPLLAGLDATPVALPATEGEALVNLLVHAGAAAAERSRRIFALGAGWREDGGAPEGLFGLMLHDRLDLAAVGAGAQQLPELLDPLVAGLTRLGLPSLARVAEDDGEPGQSWRLELELAGSSRRVGSAGARGLASGDAAGADDGASDGPGAAWLGLDLTALLGALAEVHHDERGLCWPASLAPFDVVVLPAGGSPRDAEKLADALRAAGVEVLLEDRGLEPASARRQAELWGLPWRLMVGPAKAGGLVLESRAGGRPERLELPELVARLAPDADPSARRRRLRAAF